jgi:uncharacterized membrane protein YfcA
MIVLTNVGDSFFSAFNSQSQFIKFLSPPISGILRTVGFTTFKRKKMDHFSGVFAIAVITSAVVGFWAGYRVAQSLPENAPRKRLLPVVSAVASVVATLSATYMVHALVG